MEQFVSQLARQSLAAGWVILALLVLRPLLKKLPRAYVCLLWALAAVRLVLPVVVESPVSLVPQRVANPAEFIPITPISVAPAAATQAAAQAAAPAAQSFSALLPWLWLAGVAVMGLYAIVSYIRLLSRVQVSICLGDRLYICDNVASPFILGIFRPKIYLPSEMDQAQVRLVLDHERSHLRRGDHLWKPLGYCLLCLHWFNPLCWAAYLLFCRDIEQACDERVIRNMAPQDKKAYSAALLECSLPRSAISVCPLAFGEVGVKQRIRGILNYRKPKLWALAVSGLVCVTLAACFLTDPVKGEGGAAAPAPTEALGEAVPLEIDGVESDSIMSFPQGATIYAFATRESSEVGQIAPGEIRTITQRNTIGDEIWGRIRGKDDQSDGWVYLCPATADTMTFPQRAILRSAPSEDAPGIGQTGSDQIYTILRRDILAGKQWAYVQNGEISGWVLLDGEAGSGEQAGVLATEVPEEEFPSIDATIPLSKEITIRTGPSSDAQEIGKIADGEAYIIVRRDVIAGKQWAYIQYGDLKGWILLEEQEENVSDEWTGERFAQNSNVRSMPNLMAETVYQADAGEGYTIVRQEFVEGKCWAFVRVQGSDAVGWIYLKDESEAINYFWEYVLACGQQTPDAAEGYLYFATEDAREYFRYMYAPVTGWRTSGIFQVNENLWGIQYADTQSQRAVYSFVGRMDDRLYVFQTVHDVPEALSENLDVAAYEEPNAMYVSDEWKAGFLISTRLMAFAEPARVEIAGDKDYSDAAGMQLSFADMVCGTDTWERTELPQPGRAHCTITLHAADGSTAVLSDATPAIVVTSPDGSQQAYQDYATGEDNIAMIFNWAKELAE